jgi:S1-C subfamily serine protease
MPISELTATVTHVRCFKKGKQRGVASGFFYVHADNLYLITNRHVVIKEEDDYFPDELRMRLHTNPNDIRQNDDYSIALYDNQKPLWLEHPVGRRHIDVIAFPLDTSQIKLRFFVIAYSASDHIPQNVDISIGEDVLVVGYPLGFHDTLHNLPIVRNAVLASVYPVPFQGNPILLIDARLHRGTSGSPVLTKPTSILHHTDGSTDMLNKTVTFLVGVHSATFDIEGRDPEQDEPLGLNAVWFASLIPEIITQSSN